MEDGQNCLAATRSEARLGAQRRAPLRVADKRGRAHLVFPFSILHLTSSIFLPFLLVLILVGCAPNVGTVRARRNGPRPETAQIDFKQAWCRELADGRVDVVAYALRPAQRRNLGSLDVTGSGAGYYAIWLRLWPESSDRCAVRILVPLDRPPFTPAPYAAAEELSAVGPESTFRIGRPWASARRITAVNLPARWSSHPGQSVTLDVDLTAPLASDSVFNDALRQYENARKLLLSGSSPTAPTP